MVQELKDLGICGNCVHRSGCIYLKNSMKEGRPILQCEEFDGSGPRTEGEDLPSLDCFATAPCSWRKKFDSRLGIRKATLKYFNVIYPFGAHTFHQILSNNLRRDRYAFCLREIRPV